CSSLDAMVIGKLFGAGPAGLYSRAFLLAHLPVQQPANLLTKVLFPVVSRLGIQRQADSLQISMLLVGSYAFAVSFGMIPAARDLITVLLGDQWVEAVPLLQILALAVGPVYVAHVMGTTLDAMGALKPKLRIQATKLAVLILLLLALADKGTMGVVYAVVLSEWFGFLLIAGFIFRKLSTPAREWGLILGIVIASGFATYACVWLATWLIPEVTPHWVRLLGEVSSGAIALAGVAWLSRGALAGLPVIGELSQRLPRLGRFIPVSPLQKS
ncbi:MAG: oligosaccharide flippase family protein, partial [Sulfuriferula multivorans]|nr:oligosaccharide flippase family protein [Sulfuriferula multivorans]